MPLLQWLPHSYVGPRQLHRIIIRGTMKCPGHWQLIWLTVQYFHQGNKPWFATEARVGVGVGSGSAVGAGWKRVESEIVENWRGVVGTFLCCTLCVFYSLNLSIWVSNTNGQLIEWTSTCLCTTVCVHVGFVCVCVCVDTLWCFMIETDYFSHFYLLFLLNSKASLLQRVILALNNV